MGFGKVPERRRERRSDAARANKGAGRVQQDSRDTIPLPGSRGGRLDAPPSNLKYLVPTCKTASLAHTTNGSETHW